MPDSTEDTQKHIQRVYELLNIAAMELIERGKKHDASKLQSPEKEYFDNAVDMKTLVFGSEEYKQSIEQLRPALDHHYANNSHHPQYYENGINDMNLFDVIEMFFDWKAAGERNDKGNIYKSIEINQSRHGVSKQLTQIFKNTAKYLKYEE